MTTMATTETAMESLKLFVCIPYVEKKFYIYAFPVTYCSIMSLRANKSLQGQAVFCQNSGQHFFYHNHLTMSIWS
jgi:hypothetical protein